MMGNTLLEFVCCDECGTEARVRSCGRVEYDWPETPSDGQLATMPKIRWARLTVDCPNCGVKPQDVRIGGLEASVNRRPDRMRHRLAPDRRASVQFRKLK
jgi:hypothetical protein